LNYTRVSVPKKVRNQDAAIMVACLSRATLTLTGRI